FNDGRITLRSDYWGQGAHSALPIVGEVTAQALRSRLIDPKQRFEAPPEGFFSQLATGLRDWVQGLLPPEPEPAPEPLRQTAPAPVEVPDEPASAASEPAEMVPPQLALPASAPASAVSAVPAASAASALEPVTPVVPITVTDPASAAVPAEWPR
ncbi:penicillin-binding protein, partial [Rhodoferax sp. 4810]|nr:penicillin-binding protein [Rhodoferax jenense]